MGEGLAEYAYTELGSRSIGIISIKNDNNTAAIIDGLGDGIKELAGKRSRAIRSESAITGTDEEIEEALKDLRKNNCSVCFVSLGTERMDAFFTKVEELKMTDITFLGPRSWGEADFVTMMQKHPAVKVVFPYASVISGNDDASSAQTEEAERFRIEYENRYGSDDIPTDNAALGYDSYLLLINAIHNAKSLEGWAIRDALLDMTDLRCVTGVFSFDSMGNVVRTVNLSTIKDDQVVTEYVTNKEAEAKELDDLETIQTTEDN
jgi:branched-chain amino acid transport system substrate-binding protein